MSRKILIVDDDTDALDVYRTRLTHAGYEVELAESAEVALGRVEAFRPQMVVTDVRMSGMTGLELLEHLKEHMPDVTVVVMTGHEDMETAVTAMKAGAFEFLVKPVNPRALEALADRCFRERRVDAEMSETEQVGPPAESSPMVGRDPRMIEIYKVIGTLARNRATVLLRGETGTGKEVIARAIHEHSAHAAQPFIAVNCTALTETLLESELFGHVKGSFTGATTNRKGFFELAREGTVFLDEIGDTTPEFQTKLLRVLQERQFFPVGGEEPRRTDARVIAATHQPLEELVARDRFRHDLYYRLKVIQIDIPPLRERPGDIPLLANALLGRIARQTGRDVRRISDDAMARLQAYAWPGNVREMENILTRAALLARGTTIGPDHLVLADDDMHGEDLSLAAAVRRHVRKVLARAGDDLGEAARLLDVDAAEVRRHLDDEPR